jgi:succinoglycan biosynthesis protein ExoU
VHSVPSIRRNGIGYIKPLIRRKFLLDHDLMYNESYRVGEDFEFYVRMLQAGALFVGVDRMLYGYTITKGSLSRSGRWTFPVLIDICDELEKSLPCRSEEQHALLKVRHRLVQKYNALIFFDMLKSKRTFELISMLGRNPKVIFYAIEHLVTAIFKRFLQMYNKRSFDILP